MRAVIRFAQAQNMISANIYRQIVAVRQRQTPPTIQPRLGPFGLSRVLQTGQTNISEVGCMCLMTPSKPKSRCGSPTAGRFLLLPRLGKSHLTLRQVAKQVWWLRGKTKNWCPNIHFALSPLIAIWETFEFFLLHDTWTGLEGAVIVFMQLATLSKQDMNSTAMFVAPGVHHDPRSFITAHLASAPLVLRSSEHAPDW